MALSILFIILGLVIGVVAAYVYRELSPPPGARGPRPNRKKLQPQQLIIPVIVMLLVILTGWGVKSLLFSAENKVVEEEAPNMVSNQVESDLQSGAGETVINLEEHEALAADSIMARAAIRSVPLSNNLAVMGRTSKLSRPPVKEAVALAKKVEPPQAPKPAPKPKTVKKTSTVAKPAKTNPNPKPKATEPEKSTSSDLLFTVHLASFQVKENADRSLARLKSAGAPAFVNQVELGGKTYYRLMVGRFSSREKAERYGLTLQSKGLTAGMERFVVRPFVAPGESG